MKCGAIALRRASIWWAACCMHWTKLASEHVGIDRKRVVCRTFSIPALELASERAP
jgi:hypothetical protein